jgi:putative phage-type endonuclease
MNEQGTEDWFADRLGKVTASRISDVMMAKTTAGYQNYLAQLVCERLTGIPTETFTSAAMQHGTDTEPQARAMYELESGLIVEEVGFIGHPLIHNSGASPDGLVGDDGLVEIKCPQQNNHIKTLLGANVAKNYNLQMHWQMACTERKWCDFVSFNPTLPMEMQLHIQRVDYDAKLGDDIADAVGAFLIVVEETVADLQSRYMKEAA